MAYRPGKNQRELTKIKYFMRRYLIYLIVLVVLVVGAVATWRLYNDTAEHEVSEEGVATRLVSADTYNLAMYEPETFNSLTSTEEDVMYINQIVHGFLFRLDDTLNVTPDLVDSYTTDPENGTVRLTLKEDIMFSNGFIVTANDVEKSVSFIKEAGKSSPYYQYVSQIGSISIEGEKELTIKFASPISAALDNLVFPILCATTYKKGEEFLVSCGDYTYSDYQKGKGITLIPNEYSAGASSRQPIEIMFVQDKSSIPGMITIDAVTAYLTKEPNADNIASDKSLKHVPIISSDLEYLGFNCENEYLANAAIRRAIAIAIDREKTLRDDYASDGVISDSLYYPGFLGSDTTSNTKFDPKTASDLIAGLGLKDIDEDGILETPDGEDFNLILVVNSDNSSRTDAANSIAEDLKAIGIGVEVRAFTERDFNLVLTEGNFDLYLAGLRIDKQFRLLDLYDTLNYGSFTGDRVLRLTEELERAHTADEQSSIFRELKSELYDEMPYFSICYKNYFFVSVRSLNFTSKPQFFNPYRNISTWSWEKTVPVS